MKICTMKKNIGIYCYFIFTCSIANCQYYTQPLTNATLSQDTVIQITNSTASQSIIIIQTDDGQTMQQVALPNELMGNQVVGNQVISSTPIYPIAYNAKNLNTPTIISYTPSTIRKIIITRLSTNLPQIIYYVDGDTSPDSQNKTGGIYTINTTGQGTILIWKDYLIINNSKYLIADLSSFMAKINMLEQILSSENSDIINNDILDMQTSINLIKKSDMYNQLITQVTVIEGALYELKNKCNTFTNFTKAITTIQELEKNLTVDNVDATAQTLSIYQQGAKTFQLSNFANQSANQAQALQSAILSLQNAITTIQTAKFAENRTVLVGSKVDELDAMSMGNPPALP